MKLQPERLVNFKGTLSNAIVVWTMDENDEIMFGRFTYISKGMPIMLRWDNNLVTQHNLYNDASDPIDTMTRQQFMNYCSHYFQW